MIDYGHIFVELSRDTGKRVEGVMKSVTLFVSIVVASTAWVRTVSADEVWQIHAKWCVGDGGSSGSRYRSTCAKFDQFDSVIECQKDSGNGGAVAAVQAAGRPKVNSYMDSYKPKECL